MSAPDTNIKKQEENHKGSLIGMKAVLIFAGVLLVGLLVWVVANGNEPAGAAVQVDGRTGAEIEGAEDGVPTVADDVVPAQ